jgi:hypothetical protein
MQHTAVMLSEAKHLSAQRDRPFAELTLSEANGLRACPEQSEWGDTVRQLWLMPIGEV